MSRIITTIVIVLALGGAIVLGYKAFFSPQPSATTIGTPGSSSAILPEGSELRFETVKKYNKDNRTFQYPVVSPSEIGPEIGAILTQ